MPQSFEILEIEAWWLVGGGQKRLQETDLGLTHSSKTAAYTAVISAYARSNDAQGAEQVAEAMRRERVAFNAVSYAELFRALKSDPTRDPLASERWWTRMRCDKVQPSAVTLFVTACLQRHVTVSHF